MSISESSGPREWYRAFSQRPDFESDPAQEAIVSRLQQLHEELLGFKRYRQTLLARTFGNRTPPRGLYIHGGVGRGKSVLMDGFYATLPYQSKRRVHFHEFMAQVHERMRQLQGQEDPLSVVAAQWAVESRVTCFDEFQVNDIADAMILERLFRFMIDWGVVLVLTSNQAPDQLYVGGLQRDRFLPAIALIKDRLDVVPLSGDRDHRRRHPEAHGRYYHPDDGVHRQILADTFARLCPNPDPVADIELMGRSLPVQGSGARTVWFEFDVLCGGNRSQRDYLELASRFDVLLLGGVPAMNQRQRDPARRLTWLVDILYDQGLLLYMVAETSPEGLYPEGVESGEFLRTVSRLQEMQTEEYCARARLNRR